MRHPSQDEDEGRGEIAVSPRRRAATFAVARRLACTTAATRKAGLSLGGSKGPRMDWRIADVAFYRPRARNSARSAAFVGDRGAVEWNGGKLRFIGKKCTIELV